MADRTRAWLEGLGLERYAEAFAANDLELDLVAELSDEDLQALGVISMGHRKRLLRAIARLPRATAADAGAGPAPRAEPPLQAAERRQLTLMFCDLVGSTALAQRLDPEDLRQLMRGYQDAVARAVSSHGGHVAKYLGDGVLACFGWPQAYEDQSERAVRAALRAIDAVARVAAPGGALEARIGIATGAVVIGDLVGDAGSETAAISGETPNLAFRLQQAAGPGEVCICAATRRLVGRAFDLTHLGRRSLKGYPQPMPIWRISGERRAESRFDAVHGTELTRFVGREQEVALLEERWQRARDGEGQVVLLSGEAGIGKSRILQALSDRLDGEEHTRLRYQCAAHATDAALHPVIAHLEAACGFADGDSAEVRLEKLEALLQRSGSESAGVAALLAALLSLPYETHYGALGLTPQQQKSRTFDALIELILSLAKARPLLLLFEDAHWIDPTTQELLDQTVERIRDAHILMVLTYRPDVVPPWRAHSHITALTLSRLRPSQCAQIIDHLSAGTALPSEVRAQIVEKTDGVPLFIEELTKAVLESDLPGAAAGGDTHSPARVPLAIPATLHDSLMARLDRLGKVKELAQIGAVIGREFSHRLIAALMPQPAGDLDRALDQLLASELVFRRGTPPDARYVFKHALVQDTAYGSLLKSRRQELHGRIARALEGEIDVAPELLAHHYSEAGLKQEALPYWQQAGERAARRSSNAEAIAHLRRALVVLAELPAGRQRDAHEFELLIKLGPVLMGNLGWSDVAIRQVYERAQSLCRSSDRPSDTFTATWGLWMHAQSRSEHTDAEAIAKTLLATAQRAGDDELILQAHHAIWTTSLYTGRLAAACTHIDAGLALYDPQAHRHHALFYAGHDPGVCGYCQRAIALWLLGFPEQAQASNQRGISLAHELGHAPTVAHASNFAARFETMLRHPQAAATFADKAIAIGEELGLLVSLLQGSIARGWVRVVSNDGEAGLAQIDAANARRLETKHRSAAPHYLGLFAEAYLFMGRLLEGEAQIDEALRLAAETGERVWQPELLRLRGEIRRQQELPEEAESEMQKALKAATVQGAKSLELRAATSLARLRVEQGRKEDAREVLAPVYAWFTEGHGTPDLRDARALLAALE